MIRWRGRNVTHRVGYSYGRSIWVDHACLIWSWWQVSLLRLDAASLLLDRSRSKLTVSVSPMPPQTSKSWSLCQCPTSIQVLSLHSHFILFEEIGGPWQVYRRRRPSRSQEVAPDDHHLNPFQPFTGQGNRSGHQPIEYFIILDHHLRPTFWQLQSMCHCNNQVRERDFCSFCKVYHLTQVTK